MPRATDSTLSKQMCAACLIVLGHRREAVLGRANDDPLYPMNEGGGTAALHRDLGLAVGPIQQGDGRLDAVAFRPTLAYDAGELVDCIKAQRSVVFDACLRHEGVPEALGSLFR